MTYPVDDWEKQTSARQPEAERIYVGASNSGVEPKSARTEALGRLAGGIAHDFNNLLTTIIGYSELCLAMPEGQGRMREDLKAIRHAGAQAAILTRQILAYSRQQALVPIDIDLNELVTQAADRLRHGMGEGIRLQLALAPGLGTVRIDPAQLEIAIRNLAINAREAMPSGGSLTLATRRGPMGGYAVLEVRDTGIGMDESLLSLIFDPYFSTKPIRKGAGLGLSAVEGIVLQSGGDIQVSSKPGMGSAFRISIPMSPSSVIPAAAAPDPMLPVPATILLVEDEEIVRRFCRIVLQFQGYRVLEATEGNSALALIRDSGEPIDLLVTDLVLPGMPGEVLAGHFLEANPRGGVLLMSAFPQSMLAMEGIAKPHIRFLQKPFLGGTLIENVRKCLETNRTAT
jgi:CheY-like chemotaxis protein